MENLHDTTDEEMKEKLDAAVQEALDDETYRKVKRMSYQSHNADEVYYPLIFIKNIIINSINIVISSFFLSIFAYCMKFCSVLCSERFTFTGFMPLLSPHPFMFPFSSLFT